MRVHRLQLQIISPLRQLSGQNHTPSTSTTTQCPEKNRGTKTRKMVERLVPLQHTSTKTSCSLLLVQQIETGTRQTGSTTGNSPCNLPLQTQQPHPPHHTVQSTAAQQWCRHSAPFPYQHLIGACPDYTRTYFFLRKKIPASRRAQGGTPTVSLALGANRDGKEKVKGKASWVQSSRIESALVCVRRNLQHRELNLPESTRFELISAVMVTVPTGGPIGCLVSPPPLFFQNI